MTFIKKLTASGSSTLSFVDGASGVVLDDTYKEYVFTFKDIHPNHSSQVDFLFNMSTDSGSNYNVAKTTTNFYAFNSEPSYGNEALAYGSSYDLAQGTGFQQLTSFPIGIADDDCFVGTLQLFNPSSDTFVKHFIARSHQSEGDANHYTNDTFVAGYGNTQNAVDAIQFKMESGSFNGDICLYGIA
jgi:hypothetical protein